MKVLCRRLLIFGPLLLQFCFTLAQDGKIHGKVTDSSTGAPVEYAYILNFSQRLQIYCNSKGEFIINAHPGDTLVLYALGYDYKRIVVDQELLKNEIATLKINQQSYDLNEARILGFGTYSEFRERFIDLDKPLTKTEKLNKEIQGVARTEAIEAYNEAMAKQTLANGVTLAKANILTPEEIERNKLARIEAKEKVKDQVYHKFNPMIVKQITGLTDDDEIIEFMVYCKFTDEYILETNEYDLASRISLKFELFKKHKEDQKMLRNPVNQIGDLLNILA
jgi:hypothetical protein